MSTSKQPVGNGVKKQEDGDPQEGPSKDERKDIKPVKTLNRVPRACNACRKQKMRCEGADNPPCRRCRHAGLECLFEKPSREPTLTGEAGLERIKSLEAQVADIRQSTTAIHNTLAELVHQLRNGNTHMPASNYPAYRQSPTIYPSGSPALSTPTSAGAMVVDSGHTIHPATTPGTQVDGATSSTYPQGQNVLPPMVSPGQSRHTPRPGQVPYRSPPTGPGQRPPGEMHPPSLQPPPNGVYPTNLAYAGVAHGPTLPPISTFPELGSRHGPTNISSVRYQPTDALTATRAPAIKASSSLQASPGHRSPKRKAAGSSNVTSSNTSDIEEDDNGELPSKGLVAPWEVLRGLADVAAERAAQENGDTSEPSSRQRSPSPDSKRHKTKRRKTTHRNGPRHLTFTDVVTKKIISEAEARELFKIFYAGCSTFLPVFDSSYDTYDSLHDRSPFALDCICMVAAKVRDGGGPPSETYLKCWEEVQTISCATLFAPVMRQEAVQAMILVSGWSDNGWLSGGHAVRMAAELSMHQAWPKLMKRIETGKASTSSADRELITASRIWFCLYLFEHQISYGTGRPAIMKDDESIWGSRLLLKHPLAIEDDMRLCSMLELMAIREGVHNRLSPMDRPIDDQTFVVLREADAEFRNWFRTWDHAFSQKYEDAAFYRQSLQIQQLLAELFHNAYALRGIDGPEDVQNMHPQQRQLAINSLDIAQQALTICVSSSSYREGMKYAVHYTHATATFAASFLLRLARLFPDHCDIEGVRSLVERLVAVLSEIPARRYAYTLQLMLKKAKKRRTGHSRSPTAARAAVQSTTPQSTPTMTERQHSQPATSTSHHGHHEAVSPTYERSYHQHEAMHGAPPIQHQHLAMHPHISADASNLDQIWRGFEGQANEQLPMWLTDQSLGGGSLVNFGLEAYMMPPEYDQRAAYSTPQIW